MQRKLLILALLAIALFGMASTTTFLALETPEVVVLRTFGPGGNVHEARLWIVDDSQGRSWIEVADERKSFYLRMVANPRVELLRAGQLRRYTAFADRSAQAHGRLRSLMAEKYGLADRWIGLLVDTRDSIAVYMVPGWADTP